MLRTTVYLKEEIIVALRKLSLLEQRSQAEVIRDAIDEYVRRSAQKMRIKLPPGIGAYKSGHSDISARVDEIMRQKVRKRH